MPDRQQLDEILLAPNAHDLLAAFEASGRLVEVFPEVAAMVGFGGGDTGHKDLWDHTRIVVTQCIPKISIRWAALFHDVGKVRCFRRDLGKITFHGHEAMSAKLFRQAMARTQLFEDAPETLREILFVIRNLGLVEAYEPEWTDSAVRRLVRETDPFFESIMALARADITTKHMDKRRQHLKRMRELLDRMIELAKQDAIIPPLPKGLGDALMHEFGLTPSKALGEILKTLTAIVEAGELPRQAEAGVYVQFIRDHLEQFRL